MKKNKLFLFSATALMLLGTSCSSGLDELSADNFNVVPNPLETDAGQVPTTINGTFPEKYLKKKAVITVTPELRYGDGSVAKGTSATFQGEKVDGNDQTISYKYGGNYTMKTSYTYEDAMHKSELYLTFDATVGSKTVSVPEVKVADGIIATSELWKVTVLDGISSANGLGSIAADAYQRIIAQKQEANIKFLIQQANLRKSELENNSVTEFVTLIKDINANKETLELTNIEVSAYASPDGGLDLNEKLANQRGANSESYVKKQLKGTDLADASIETTYTAEDWDGFKELVQASDIQDKDVILRVLSMYSDPEEREAQIKNISSAFKELADGILPELRRARLTINYNTIGRSDEQIQEQYAADASQLSLEEILYAASLTDDVDKKEEIYKKAIELYPDDARAYNNVAAIEYSKGNYSEAKKYANKAVSIDSSCAEANANLALLALEEGDLSSAQSYLAKAQGADGYNEILGNLDIAQGKYSQAVKDFGSVNSNSAALAKILTEDYAGATTTLNNVSPANATTSYLKGIVNARQGNSSAAASAAEDAVSKDSKTWKTYYSEDLEFSK